MDKLTAKVLAEIGIMFVILCLAVFLPAGSFNFWQAWLYLPVFFVPTVFITIYLLIKSPQLVERRMRGLSQERRTIQKIIQLMISPLFFPYLSLPDLIIASIGHMFLQFLLSLPILLSFTVGISNFWHSGKTAMLRRSLKFPRISR